MKSFTENNRHFVIPESDAELRAIQYLKSVSIMPKSNTEAQVLKAFIAGYNQHRKDTYEHSTSTKQTPTSNNAA